jgi:uncharacterized protein (TIGR03435 family)
MRQFLRLIQRNRWLAAGCLLIPVPTIAQTEARPQFEVASIRPAAPLPAGIVSGTSHRIAPDGGIVFTNVTLEQLIEMAWGRREVVGITSWMRTGGYDISAKPSPGSTSDQTRSMLQTLLEERFRLTHHNETREVSVYVLVLKKDGKLGPRITEAKHCDATPPESCDKMNTGGRRIEAQSTYIRALAPMLSRALGRRVIDKTGLAGTISLLSGRSTTTTIRSFPRSSPRFRNNSA